MRTLPITPDNEAPAFSVANHAYDVNLSHGKWRVHLCSKSGQGVYTGPAGHYGRLTIVGKVCRELMDLPTPVALLLIGHGYSA